MDGAEAEVRWAEFMAEQGLSLEQEILEQFRDQRHLLNIEDGTHASWHDDRLGVLLVFRDTDAADFVGAWRDADAGNLLALGRMLEWMTGLVHMVEHCVALYGSSDFDES